MLWVFSQVIVDNYLANNYIPRSICSKIHVREYQQHPQITQNCT